MLHHILAIATITTSLLAQTTVNVACARDNTLYQSPTGALSAGAGTNLFVGVTGQASNALRRAVIYFDVATAVPSGARIVSASLTVNVNRSNPQSPATLIVHGHRVLQDWGEGTSVPAGGGGGGTAATANDATWLHTFFPGSTWTNPGGDFAAAPSLSLATPQLGPATSPVQSAVLADVQSWLDNPAQNFGWLLKSNEAAPSTARRIDSRENLTGSPPVLTITYLTNGQATTWGQGCPVGAGTFQHAWLGAPIGGTTPQLTQTNGPPGALAANLLSLGYDPIGFPLLPQCNLYLPLNFIVNHSIFSLDNSGNGSTPIALPAGFPGVMFTSQTAAIDSSPAGFVLSNVAIALLQ